MATDVFAARPAPKGPPGGQRDRILDKPHAPIGEQHVDASGMIAAGRIGETATGLAKGAATEPAAVDFVLTTVGRLEHVEQRDARRAIGPNDSADVGNVRARHEGRGAALKTLQAPA